MVNYYYSYAAMALSCATKEGIPISEWKKLHPKETTSLKIEKDPNYATLARRFAKKEKMRISEWKKLHPKVEFMEEYRKKKEEEAATAEQTETTVDKTSEEQAPSE